MTAATWTQIVLNKSRHCHPIFFIYLIYVITKGLDSLLGVVGKITNILLQIL